jgi:hypothetical protein
VHLGAWPCRRGRTRIGPAGHWIAGVLAGSVCQSEAPPGWPGVAGLLALVLVLLGGIPGWCSPGPGWTWQGVAGRGAPAAAFPQDRDVFVVAGQVEVIDLDGEGLPRSAYRDRDRDRLLFHLIYTTGLVGIAPRTAMTWPVGTGRGAPALPAQPGRSGAAVSTVITLAGGGWLVVVAVVVGLIGMHGLAPGEMGGCHGGMATAAGAGADGDDAARPGPCC